MKKLLAVGAAMAAMCAVGGERIVFVGDSITGQSRNHSAGFAKQLDAAYAATIAEAADRPTVISLGGSGQTVESWLNVEKNSRDDKQTTLDVAGVYVGENLDQHADRMVVMLGMNNVLSPSTADTPESIAKFKENLHALVTNLVRRATPTVLYLASVPPCTEDPLGPKNAVIGKLNAQIRALVGELPSDPDCTAYVPSLKVRYAPAWENQTDLLVAGRALSPTFHVTGDMVHPNAVGHIRLAQTFLDAFGHDDASAWLAANRLQPELDATANGNASGISYSLVATGDGSSAGLYAFTLTVDWVTKPGETAPGSVAFGLELPDGWRETADAVASGLTTVFAVEGPAELASTPIKVNATPATGAARTTTVGVPAPWRVSTPVAVNWSNASGKWVYRPEAACETEAAIAAGSTFAEIESASATRTPSWRNLFAGVNYVGGADAKSLDFSAVSYYPTFGTSYALRYVYAKRATDATVTLSSQAFSATLDTEVWLNGVSVLSSAAASGAAQVRLQAGNNVIAVRSSHTTWQWQVGVELTAADNSFPLRYGLAPLAAEKSSADAAYAPEKMAVLFDGSIVYAVRSNCSFRATCSGRADVFLVGGGGGGGGNYLDVIEGGGQIGGSGYDARAGGGGGGGGVVYREGLAIAADTDYPIVIGAGGEGNCTGEPTTAFDLEALGGGHGGRKGLEAASGGSGGGAGAMSKTAEYTDGAAASQPAVGELQGNGGGKGYSAAYNAQGYGGGGGGAGGPGGDATTSTYGAGGVGRACPFVENSLLYGAGGRGGTGAYGTNDPLKNAGANGADGTGAGGDGCNAYVHVSAGRGGRGGSGIVLVRFYPDESQLDPADFPLMPIVTALPGGRIVYTYNTPGVGLFNPPAAGKIQVFIVGGGGGGGGCGIPRDELPTDSGTYSGGGYSTRGGGGGGGGAVVSNDAVVVEKRDYIVTVGAGGAQNENGFSSRAFGLEAPGGGAGAWNNAAAQAGGPCGGGNYNHLEGASAEGFFSGGASIVPGGNAGYGGGGAGAGGAGGDATSNASGAGGAGVVCPFIDDATIFGAGGAGGMSGVQKSPFVKSAPDAENGTGQGGQGCNSWYHVNAGAGGAGGCGCVIIVCSPGTDYFKEEVKLEAEGGEKRAVRDAGKKWITHAFLTNGTFTVLQPMCVQAFLVGGGGAGGSASNVRGGGGGAGGVVRVDKLFLLPGEHAITVGRGGVDKGENGTSSLIDGAYEAFGGGGGGNAWSGAGKAGGSGGGACGPYSSSAEELNVSGGAGTPGQGFAGGNAHWVKSGGTNARAGGGGGAAGPGVDGFADSSKGAGGDGVCCTFLGPDCYYAAGGGGGGISTSLGVGGPGGMGGTVQLGGTGGYYVGGSTGLIRGGDGVDGTGSGGGGEGGTANQNSGWGKGGSGIVILRYRPVPNGMQLLLR